MERYAPDEEIRELLQYPDEIGRAVGFKDLTKLHRGWILNMVYGQEDYTLQAHRGSYKSSCLAVAISLLLYRAHEQVHQDHDVSAEMVAEDRVPGGDGSGVYDDQPDADRLAH